MFKGSSPKVGCVAKPTREIESRAKEEGAERVKVNDCDCG